MNTPFTDIYDIFLNKITDFYIYDLSDDDVQEFCRKLLMSALPKINPLKSNLAYDSLNEEFTSELIPVEKEIIAIQMVAEWIEPQLNNTLLLKQFIGTKDEKFFAQANQIGQLENLLEMQSNRSKKLRRDYQYRNFKF